MGIHSRTDLSMQVNKRIDPSAFDFFEVEADGVELLRTDDWQDARTEYIDNAFWAQSNPEIGWQSLRLYGVLIN